MDTVYQQLIPANEIRRYILYIYICVCSWMSSLTKQIEYCIDVEHFILKVLCNRVLLLVNTWLFSFINFLCLDQVLL